MANPFLVLGGIAISVITAAFGILSVPGWVNSAHNASALNDVSSLSLAEAAAVSTLGTPLAFPTATSPALSLNDADAVSKTGVKVTVNASTANAVVLINAATKEYATVVKSASSEGAHGVYYVRLNNGPIHKVVPTAATTMPATYAAAATLHATGAP